VLLVHGVAPELDRAHVAPALELRRLERHSSTNSLLVSRLVLVHLFLLSYALVDIKMCFLKDGVLLSDCRLPNCSKWAFRRTFRQLALLNRKLKMGRTEISQLVLIHSHGIIRLLTFISGCCNWLAKCVVVAPQNRVRLLQKHLHIDIFLVGRDWLCIINGSVLADEIGRLLKKRLICIATLPMTMLVFRNSVVLLRSYSFVSAYFRKPLINEKYYPSLVIVLVVTGVVGRIIILVGIAKIMVMLAQECLHLVLVNVRFVLLLLEELPLILGRILDRVEAQLEVMPTQIILSLFGQSYLLRLLVSLERLLGDRLVIIFILMA
jgi:hypothetical protein